MDHDRPGLAARERVGVQDEAGERVVDRDIDVAEGRQGLQVEIQLHGLRRLELDVVDHVEAEGLDGTLHREVAAAVEDADEVREVRSRWLEFDVDQGPVGGGGGT